MSKGFVYVLTNPSMPGIVKIGKTTRSVDQRADELYQTGVPERFTIAGQVASPDCSELERKVHVFFQNDRVSHQREFFRVPADKAVAVLKARLNWQLDEFVSEFAPGHGIACVDFISSCEGHLEYHAREMDLELSEIADLLSFLETEDFKRAAFRRDELYAAVAARREAEERGNVIPLDRSGVAL